MKRAAVKKLLLRRGSSEDSGAAAVEFALVLPLLCVFVFGIITYGYILSLQQAVTQAVAEGARSAAITATTHTDSERSTKAKRSIDEVMDAYGLECGKGHFDCTIIPAACEGDPESKCVTVKAEYDWEEAPRIPAFPLLPTPKTISHSSTIEVS